MIMWLDIVNGLFEVLAAPFICISIWKLYKDKKAKGVSWIHIGFFSLWGVWNLFYYPSLNQWFSFIGGILVVVANSGWLFGLIYYTIKGEK